MVEIQTKDEPTGTTSSKAVPSSEDENSDSDSDDETKIMEGEARNSETEIPYDDYYNSTSSVLSDGRWEEMYQKLLEFKEVHGHCLVPNRYKEDLQLGAWVAGQRKNYKLMESGSGKRTKMTMERARKLIDVGFQWTAKNPRHLMWEVRFAELKDFQANYGHAQVPIGWDQNVQLANWVSTQRQEYKNLIKGKTSRLNDQRVTMLNNLGFAWELQRGGRRRRLAVNKDRPHGSSHSNPPHPADQQGAAVAKRKVAKDPEDKFAIDDGTTIVKRGPGGRKRTTLKKKITNVDGSSKCILPGVAIMGGGRDSREAPGVRPAAAGSSTTTTNAADNDNNNSPIRPSGAHSDQNESSPMEANSMDGNNNMNRSMLQQQQFNNESFFRTLQGGGGNGGAGGSNPWQLLPNGAYQQNSHPLAHLMGGSNPFFPMTAGPFGMNPFGMAGGPQSGIMNMNGNMGMGGGGGNMAMGANMNANIGGQGELQNSDSSDNSGNGSFGNSGLNGMNPHEMEMLRMQMQQAGAFGMHNGMNGMGMSGTQQHSPSMNPNPVPKSHQENHNANNNNVDGMQQQQQMNSQMPNQGMNCGMSHQFGNNLGWPGGMQGPFWNMSENAAAAAAAAAQHLQAAAALTAGIDERSLPPGLAQMAHMARRINGGMQGDGSMLGMGGMPCGMHVGGNMNMNGPGVHNMMGMGGMGTNPMMAMQVQQQQQQQQQGRARREDPPADPPGVEFGGSMADGTTFAGQSPERLSNKRRMPVHGGQRANKSMKKMKSNEDVFEDADEED